MYAKGFAHEGEILCFYKINGYRLENLDYKPTKFYDFELHLKNKPLLNCFKRG